MAKAAHVKICKHKNNNWYSTPIKQNQRILLKEFRVNIISDLEKLNNGSF